MLILGLMVTQLGLLLTLHQTTFIDPLMNIISIEAVELLDELFDAFTHCRSRLQTNTPHKDTNL